MRPGARPVKRSTRVGELLRQILASILLERVADLEELTIALDKAMGFIKQEVAREHVLRTMPELHFVPDDTLDKAERLERLLNAARTGLEKE
jgi:ribosome-binding factor A